MVVGTGTKTIQEIYELEDADPVIVFGSGDGTVPMGSAAMGNIDPSLVHYVCDVVHGSMSGQRPVTRAINGYLLRGDPIEGVAAPCNI
jgi:hypothetical protein